MKITLSRMIAIASAVGSAAQNLRGPALLEQGSSVASFSFPSSSSKWPSSGHVSRQLSVPEWVWTLGAPGRDAKDIGCGLEILTTGIIDRTTDGVGIYELYSWEEPMGPDQPWLVWAEFPMHEFPRTKSPTKPAGVNIDYNLFRAVTADSNGNLYEVTRNTNWTVVPDVYATDVGVSMASINGMGRVCVIGENLPEKEGNGFIYCESLSTPGEFNKLPGNGVRIAVKSNGYPVVVNTQGGLWSFHGSHWNRIANGYDYIDVAVGPDDVIWAVTSSNEVVAIFDTSIILDYGIVDLDTTTIFPMKNSRPAKRISVDSQGNPWIVTAPDGQINTPDGEIYKGEPQNFLGCGGDPNDVWYSAILGCSPSSSQWRIRNAGEASGRSWALRGLRFCKDLNCNDIATGQVFDDGNTPEWVNPSSLFDDDMTDIWKSWAGGEKGKAFVGLKLDEPTHISAVGIRPDNVAYGISEVYVEYFDEETGSWMNLKTLKNVPKHYGDIGSGGPNYQNDVWYTAALN